jgi:hypothetical protein
LNEVTLLQIHRFDPSDVQFQDALVSSAVVWFKNKKPGKNHKAKFTYGGTIDRPTHEKDVSLSTLAQKRNGQDSRFQTNAKKVMRLN